MKILSFDQATITTGWSLFLTDCEHLDYSNCLIEYGTLHVHKRDDIPNWILMAGEICQLIGKYHPNIVVIEDTIMQKSTNTLKELTRLQGTLIWYCFSKNIRIETIYPSQWRKIIALPVKHGMKRTELKTLAKNFVKNECLVNCVTDDESDAICIGVAYIKKYLQENKEIDYE